MTEPIPKDFERLRAEIERLRARVFELVGMGGYAGDAPKELLLYAYEDHGCDTWLWVNRFTGRLPERATKPVRFVRADQHDALQAENERLKAALKKSQEAYKDLRGGDLGEALFSCEDILEL